ncbi:D-alanyl-D-alanine carboxypeptidase-like protein [Promicromonospora sp. AC04]|uniref:M15 family metallopeptidase n=1 Tax=Promicromonospora sp. AC04 TaxID=2135723 RepID=UPI000D4305A2|nr:M15 family metallopeptidase [Promicromonospora sp. AC04]PUB29670.1 D-alanyl-D-alanine carboxypeptidase-like protein [Promicromonospora sp. AC04]
MTEKRHGHLRNGAEAGNAEPSRRKPSEHQAGAAFLRKGGTDQRRTAVSRHARNAWTGAVALAVTGGVLVSASASVPTSGPLASGSVASTASGTTASRTEAGTGQASVRLGGVRQDGRTVRTTPEGVTVGQVLAVLDRAERKLRQDPSLGPGVAQAAAELGMLYTTYQAQQLALAEADEPLRVQSAPTAGEAGSSEVPDATVSAEPVSRFVTGNPERGSARAEEPPAEIPAPARAASETQDRTVSRPHAEEQGPGYVAFSEVAVAAMRLANMLDPSSPTALIETLPDAGTSLRRNLLETVAAYGDSTAGYTNGRIPADVLCPLEFAPGHLLRCDAAERLTALSAEFEKEFGYPIPLTDSYRSYAMQVAVKGTKPHLAAIPGTSNHGWGLAIDLGDPIAGGSSPEYVWLRLHGPDYGWDNPSWAQLGGAKPEPWHFEFFAAGSIPNRAIDPSDVGTWAPATPTSPIDPASPDFLPAAGRTPAETDPGTSGADGGSKPVDEPSAPAKPAPAKPVPAPEDDEPAEPAPADPPAENPGSDDDPVDAAVDDTVQAVDDTLDGTVDAVDGVVSGVVGGLLGADSTGKDSANEG